MDVERTTAAGLARAATGLLAADPWNTNVIAVRLARATSGDDWFVMRDDDGVVVGIAMRTPPFPLFLSAMPVEASRALADRLLADGVLLNGVNGAEPAAGVFADAWCAATGSEVASVLATRLHRLDRLQPPAGVPGAARTATVDDLPLVLDQVERFAREALPGDPPVDRDRWTGTVAGGRAVLWTVEGEPVSLACRSAAAQGVARVGPVYTPSAHRRHGYGAAGTAAVTAAALADDARDVVLYTDLANPTSNAIYASIGYRRHSDSAERRFRPR